jgi:hypothetical protein
MADRLSERIESYRDNSWNRDPELRIEDRSQAERFIDRLGFCGALIDSRRPGPSLFIAVCGRRDAHAPRNVQKDPEMNLAWSLKDELLGDGKIYYGKLIGSRSTFISRRLVSHFNQVLGLKRQDEPLRLTPEAQKVLKTLRKEWELSTGELREASGIQNRSLFTRVLDELQRTLKIVPTDVIYAPRFTYVWGVSEGRFREELANELSVQEALKEIARAYLLGAGMTLRGELARVSGLSNPNAGLGNWALVDEGFATRLSPGVYCLKGLKGNLDRSTYLPPASGGS